MSILSALLALLSVLLIAAPHTHGEEARKKGNQPRNAPESESAANIRIGKYPDHIRIVFETTESYVDRASVLVIGENDVKVDFQSPVIFRIPQKGSPKTPMKLDKGRPPLEVVGGLRITATDSSCTMQIENLDDISVSKLASPARLVIDAFIGKGASGAAADTEEVEEIRFETLMIDAGHGGHDSGIRYGSKAEKDITLLFAKELANALGKKGKKVFLTRKGDQTISLKERVKTANYKTPGLFLSIHTSSANEFAVYSPQRLKGRSDRPQEKGRSDKSAAAEGRAEEAAQGAKGRQQTADADAVSEALANAIAQSVKNEFKADVRQKKLPARIITGISSPALLIELPGPGKFNYDGKTRERLIDAILRGLASRSANQGAALHRQGPVEG